MPTLIARARAGDGDAFRELTEPHRRELQVHCYRMLGSFQDAEDALQDTLLAAWQGLAEFEGRASIRTWLYRIATNRCLNARRSASRRPAKAWNVPGVEPPEPTRLGEVVWLEPFPDALLDGASDAAAGPGGSLRADANRSRSAFVTALQVLPPRQVAVLILRDVLGFHAERGGRHARRDRRIGQQRPQAGARRPAAPPAAGRRSRAGPRRRLTRRGGDRREVRPARRSPPIVDALVALLTDDVFVSMPPMPFEYEGRDVVSRFCASIFGAGRRFDLAPTRANGQPAFGTYLRGPDGVSHGVGLFVLTLSR